MKPITTILSAALVALSLLAVGPTAIAKDGDKPTVAPLTGMPDLPIEAPDFAIPEGKSFKLPNGLEVVVVESHAVPTVDILMAIPGGAFLDHESKRGMCDLMTAVMPLGTKSYDTIGFSTAIEKVGGGLDVGCTTDSVEVSAYSLSPHFDHMLELMAELVLTPTFPEVEIEKERARQLQRIKLKQSSPEFLAYEAFYDALYGNHPYATYDVDPKVVETFTKKDLEAEYDKTINSYGAVLVVNGDVTFDEVKAKVTKLFGPWKMKPVTKEELMAPPKHTKRKIILIDRPGSTQSVVVMGGLGLEYGNPDHVALKVATDIFGGGMRGRLFKHLREEKGLTYGAYASVEANKQLGCLIGSLQTATSKTSQAIEELLKELDLMVTTSVTADELANAKSYLIGSFALKNSSPAAINRKIAYQRIYGLKKGYWKSMLDEVAAATTKDLEKATAKYYPKGRELIVVVGDAAALEKDLAAFGTVEKK